MKKGLIKFAILFAVVLGVNSVPSPRAGTEGCIRPGEATRVASQIVTQWLNSAVGSPSSRLITQPNRRDLRQRIAHALLDVNQCE